MRASIDILQLLVQERNHCLSPFDLPPPFPVNKELLSLSLESLNKVIRIIFIIPIGDSFTQLRLIYGHIFTHL